MDDPIKAMLKTFRADETVKFQRIPDPATALFSKKILNQYRAFTYAREHWKPELYELLMYDGHQRRPWEWLLGFLDYQADVIVVPRGNKFDSSWFPQNNHAITIEPKTSYWFANGADAFYLFGTRYALDSYYVSNVNHDWLIFYDELSNCLFLCGEQAMAWARAVQDGFYDALGLTHNDDIRLSDVQIEDWGYRLVLSCRYQTADADLDYYQRMTLIFDDCRYFDWIPSVNLSGKPHDKSQRLWMWLGYQQPSGKMIVPALLDSYALVIKFTYREMVVVKH